MFYSRFFPALIAMLLASGPLTAQTSAHSNISEKEISQLIEQLGSPSFRVREKASAQLDNAGESAIPALLKVLESENEEVRQRAIVAMDKIQKTIRSEKALVAPKLSLSFNKVPLERAVQEVGRKANIQFALEGAKIKDLQRTVTCDIENVPFWQAIEDFYNAAGLMEDLEPSKPSPPTQGTYINRSISSGRSRPMGQTFRLVDGKSTMPVILDRSIRVRMLPANFHLNKYDQSRGELILHALVDAHPNSGVQRLYGIDVHRVSSPGSVAVKSFYPSSNGEISFGELDVRAAMIQNIAMDQSRMISVSNREGIVPIHIKTDGSPITSLSELKGVLAAQILMVSEPVVIVPDIANAVGKTFHSGHGISCRVQKVTIDKTLNSSTVVEIEKNESADEMIDFQVMVRGQARQFIQIRRLGGLQPSMNQQMIQFSLLNEDKSPLIIRRIQTKSFNSWSDGVTERTKSETELHFVNSAKSGALTLQVKQPMRSTIEMPFEFKNISLR